MRQKIQGGVNVAESFLRIGSKCYLFIVLRHGVLKIIVVKRYRASHTIASHVLPRHVFQ